MLLHAGKLPGITRPSSNTTTSSTTPDFSKDMDRTSTGRCCAKCCFLSCCLLCKTHWRLVVSWRLGAFGRGAKMLGSSRSFPLMMPFSGPFNFGSKTWITDNSCNRDFGDSIFEMSYRSPATISGMVQCGLSMSLRAGGNFNCSTSSEISFEILLISIAKQLNLIGAKHAPWL